MIIILASLLTIGVLVFILTVRTKDLPEPEPVSPFEHLDERKAAIYENLRDLQFEYRVGKLSDQDYQQTKQDLQKVLAGVLAEIDRLKQSLATQTPLAPAPKKTPQRYVCPSCKAEFPTALKFCGECGKPMRAAQA
jgi:Predicted nucleic acid-binding protein, consists of a PIN domain and a Zn-ribbon module